MSQAPDQAVAVRAEAPVSGAALEDPRVIRAVREYLAALEAGERPDRGAFEARYPELAPALAGCLEALEFVRSAASSLAPVLGREPAAALAATTELQPDLPLGDYRIVREIGRGGMGVVYEAVQVSLGRRVALKVLPVEAARDAKLRARFQRESRAAAQLHHSNIVPVFEVGQEGNASFYAMQYIQGQSLDLVIQELRQLRASSGEMVCQDGGAAAGAVARSLLTGQFEPAPALDATIDAPLELGEAATGACPAGTTAAPVALPGSSELSSVATDYRRYCRQVARIGLQVAEALAYAHGRGIVHRDIKPSNLLLDSVGLVWVSDFGLAKTQEQALTETGDVVGTLRYMAPERFGGECDARADVYALGLTLYELLLLRPAFDAPDRLHLIDQIGHQEPARPRGIDPRIPRDLETILMKAIEKEPRRRYASAEVMAEDLRRFLADEPIRARRLGPLERLGRWGRRNPLVAGLSAAVVLVTALGFAGVFGQMQVARANAVQAHQERDEVRALNHRLQRTLYAAHMNLAKQAWDAADIERVVELLEEHGPKAGEPDLRGFEWRYLYRLCHADLLTLKGLTGRVSRVAYSPDGKRLAGAGGDRTVKVWDAQTGQELLTLKDEGGGVAFSPDGKRLVTGRKVWDTQTGRELLTLKGGHGVTFSPDSKRLAGAGGEPGKPGEVKVWDAQTGQELLSLQGHTGQVNSVTFSPDGKRLASADNYPDYLVKVWDAQTGQELCSIKGGGWDVAYSPDGKRLASNSGDMTVKVWDAQTGQELLTCKGHTGQVNSIVFSPDGKRLASTSGDRTVKVWDAQTGQELFTFKKHTGVPWKVVFSPDGTRLASGTWDGTVKVWDATTSQEARTFRGPTGSVRSVAFSPDAKRLASGSNTWDDTKKAYVPGEVKVWEAQTGQELRSCQGHTGEVTSVVFSPDGKRLASAAADKTVKVWEAQTGQELRTCQGHTGIVSMVAFSADGKRLASASEDKTVKVWDAQTGQEIVAFKGHTGLVQSVAFSPDGKRLASAAGEQRPAGRGGEGEVKVWDAQTGQEILTWKVNLSPGRPHVAFSPDGKRLASTSSLLKVWDAQTGQELLSLKGHTGHISSVVFSPDGKRLASSSGSVANRQGGEVKVWDAQTGQELLTLKGGGLGRIGAFSPNGHWLVSVAGGTVKIYDATPLPEKP
jgi:WD40 repeat protein/serine/threonine protein kinase